MKKLTIFFVTGWFFLFCVHAGAEETPFVFRTNDLSIQLKRIGSGSGAILRLEITAGQKSIAKVFPLESPNRIVLDLEGISVDRPHVLKPTIASTIKKIRLANHPNRVRIVLDFDSPFIPQFKTDYKSSTTILLISEQQPLAFQPSDTPVAVIPTLKVTVEAPVIIQQKKVTPRPTPFAISKKPDPYIIDRGRLAPVPTKSSTATATSTPTPTATATTTLRASVKQVPIVTPKVTSTPKPTNTATATKTPAGTATPRATIPPTLTPTNTSTPTHTSTPIPTVTPTSAPTSTPTPIPTLAKKRVTPTPTAQKQDSLSNRPALIDLSFERDPKDKQPAVRLRLNRRLQFQVRKQHDERYQVIISNCQLAFKRLSLPLFPPQTFTNFTMAIADTTGNNVTVTIGIERGTKVNYFAIGNEIWIKSLNPEK